MVRRKQPPPLRLPNPNQPQGPARCPGHSFLGRGLFTAPSLPLGHPGGVWMVQMGLMMCPRQTVTFLAGCFLRDLGWGPPRWLSKQFGVSYYHFHITFSLVAFPRGLCVPWPINSPYSLFLPRCLSRCNPGSEPPWGRRSDAENSHF